MPLTHPLIRMEKKIVDRKIYSSMKKTPSEESEGVFWRYCSNVFIYRSMASSEAPVAQQLCLVRQG